VPEIPNNIEGLSIKELKNLLDKLGVKRDDCFEKEDLVNRVKEAKNGKKPPPSSSQKSRARTENTR